MKNYYQAETEKALKNFPFSVPGTHLEVVFSIVAIKKAAACANHRAGNIDSFTKDLIIQASDKILNGGYNKQFILSGLQGGAGTAVNMNVNEVVASLATELSGGKKIIHPNDEVNKSQSTNDVNPSALKIATFALLQDLEISLASLVKTFENRSKDFKKVLKLGRTHLQDAIPTTLGSEFGAYAFNLKKHLKEIKKAKEICLTISLGGTAIGNSINASPKYISEVYKELNKITGINFKPSDNKVALTSSQTDFLMISQIIVSLCLEMSKIANDLRFLSSGTIGEINLSKLQNGSSIMPGKVNPVIPEVVNQLYYLISGNNVSIEKAVAAAELELGVMFPIISDKLIESVKITKEVIDVFDSKCISLLSANEERCLAHLENSMAYATLFVPKFGYDLVSDMILIAVKTKRTFKDVIVSDGYLSIKEFDKIVKDFINSL